MKTIYAPEKTNHCLRCNRLIFSTDIFCSNPCYTAFVRQGPGTETDAILRAHERAGQRWLREIGVLPPAAPRARKVKPAVVKPPEKVWCGSPPDVCDICSGPIQHEFYDGKTERGPWASMCALCHLCYGVGLGEGRGQKYKHRPSDGAWVKVKG